MIYLVSLFTAVTQTAHNHPKAPNVTFRMNLAFVDLYRSQNVVVGLLFGQKYMAFTLHVHMHKGYT